MSDLKLECYHCGYVDNYSERLDQLSCKNCAKSILQPCSNCPNCKTYFGNTFTYNIWCKRCREVFLRPWNVKQKEESEKEIKPKEEIPHSWAYDYMVNSNVRYNVTLSHYEILEIIDCISTDETLDNVVTKLKSVIRENDE